MMIDPETRDVVENIYIRKVEKVGGNLVNVEIGKVENVKDPSTSNRRPYGASDFRMGRRASHPVIRRMSAESACRYGVMRVADASI